MTFSELNPFVRIATRVSHCSQEDRVWVKDCRLFYVLSGTAELYVENQRYAMEPDALFYCRSGVRYGIVSQGIDLLCVNFDLDQHNHTHLPSYPRINAREFPPDTSWEPMEGETYLNSWLFLPAAGQYRKEIQELLEEFSTRQIFFRERSSGILKTLLLQLHRQSISVSTSAAQAVADTIAFIKTNFSAPLTNAQLSQRTGYHEYHLNRLFLRHTGSSIHRYILSTRIDAAKAMLLNTDASLAAIAEAVGFNSNTHFSTYFRKTVGITPQEFRTHFKNRV